LQTIAASKLDLSDAGLLKSVRRVASELRITPDAANVRSPVGLLNEDEKEKDKASGPALTIERARATLERTVGLASGQDGGTR
jgi:hypothetical protein